MTLYVGAWEDGHWCQRPHLTRTLCVPATSHHYRAVPTWIKTLLLYSRHRRCGGTVEAGGLGSGFESRRTWWSPQVLLDGASADRLRKTRDRRPRRTSATRIDECARLLRKPASGASSELEVTVSRAEGRNHGTAEEWTQLGSSSNMGRDGGLSGPGEGRLSVLAWRGQEEAVVIVDCSRRQRRKNWSTREGNKSMPV